MTNSISKKDIRLETLIAAVIIAMLTLVFAVAVKPVSLADGEGTVTVHIFDPSGEYDRLGVWAWVKGGSGRLFADPEVQDGELFAKEGNTAQSITVRYRASEVAKLKSHMPMGLLAISPGFTGAHVNSGYNKETQDIFLDIADAFDENDHADVYYIRKDTVAYLTIEEAVLALEKVTSARFTAKTATTATVEFDSTLTIADGTTAELYANGEMIAEGDVTPGELSSAGTATFETEFDFAVDYEFKITGVPTGAPVSKAAFMDDPDFIATFERDASSYSDYGVTATDRSSRFVVWAPFAAGVTVNVYDSGVMGEGEPVRTLEMKKRTPDGGVWGGVWEGTLTGNYLGKYYTYVVANSGADTETIDPYAKACGVNGNRGMILDLKSTDPAGWKNDKHLYATDPVAADTPVVWEVQVNDFSASPDSGMKYKGKYLAFTETGTTVPGTNVKTGVDYLKDLGITYVHLNPVYDFVTVDEMDASIADNTKDRYNWGYDPQNYNIPEGTYSTDPTDGAVRIKEFKQMVMALHKAGIGVIMDVVYNHTFSTGGQALHDTVPNYYHRSDNGVFSDGSGCGNETASERGMMRKYMIDSLVYWATEYHIDGFRFDLMGLHDTVTMTDIRRALDALDGGNGEKILLYGEPWSADGQFIPDSFKKRIAASDEPTNKLIKTGDYNALPDRVAIFNDATRDGLRGDNNPGWGWAQGNDGKTGDVAATLNGTAKGLSAASRTVAYASAHDNYTLWDQLTGKQGGKETPLFYENAIDHNVKMCKLISSAYLMSPGIAFMLAGEEMGRTKYGNHNSYNSPIKGNRIEWSRQIEFAGLHDHYKKLIAARRQYSAELFSYSKSTDTTFTAGNFSANGLTVFGTRGNLMVTLDAGAKTGSVAINGIGIVSF